MSYSSIYRCANDPSFLNRLTGCAADEGSPRPLEDSARLAWIAASANDIEAAYLFALAADNPNPGGDPTVITDEMILSVYQANPPTSP